MPYNRNLYSSSESAIDAGMVYDQTEEKLQSEINVEVTSNITELDETLSTFVRPNLLDNWYFVGGGSQLGDGIFPINQSWTTASSAAGDFFDRWYRTTTGTSVCRITADGLRADDTQIYIRQGNGIKSSLIGKTLTCSILYKNNGLKSITRVLEENGRFSGLSAGIGITYTTGGMVESVPNELIGFYIVSTDYIVAVKLEIGDTQTLAHQENGVWVLNEIPNLEEEYLKCNDYSDRKNPRPNLLNNWYFEGGGSQLGDGIFPINQRGLTSYTLATGDFCLDKWFAVSNNTTVSVNTNNIQTNNVIGQELEPKSFLGKTITISALDNNNLYVVTGSVPSSIPSAYTVIAQVANTIRVSLSPSKLRFQIHAGQWKAAKLEIGDTQTLAHQENGVWVLNEIPNWEEELRKCDGRIRIQSSNLDVSASPTVSAIGQAFTFSDKNGLTFGQIYPGCTRAGQNTLVIRTNKIVSGATKSNYLMLNVNPDGAANVLVSDASAWRSALGVVNKAGDSMTGNLTIINGAPNHSFINTSMDITNASYSSSTITSSSVIFYDKNSYASGQCTDRYETDGSTGILLGGCKRINGTNTWNMLRLLVKPDGSLSVLVTSPAAWRKALGLCYAANDTFSNTASSLVLNGTIDSNKRNLYLDFVTEKSMENISTIAVTTMTGSVLGASGVIISGGTNLVNPPTYTVTCIKQGTHHIRINVQTNAAISSAVANSPVTYFGSLALKFT